MAQHDLSLLQESSTYHKTKVFGGHFRRQQIAEVIRRDLISINAERRMRQNKTFNLFLIFWEIFVDDSSEICFPSARSFPMRRGESKLFDSNRLNTSERLTNGYGAA